MYLYVGACISDLVFNIVTYYTGYQSVSFKIMITKKKRKRVERKSLSEQKKSKHARSKFFLGGNANPTYFMKTKSALSHFRENRA